MRRDAIGRREPAAVDDAQPVGRRAQRARRAARSHGRPAALGADRAGMRADRAQQLLGVMVVRLEEHVVEQRAQRRRLVPPQDRRETGATPVRGSPSTVMLRALQHRARHAGGVQRLIDHRPIERLLGVDRDVRRRR